MIGKNIDGATQDNALIREPPGTKWDLEIIMRSMMLLLLLLVKALSHNRTSAAVIEAYSAGDDQGSC
jgi:hypothetical protein